MYATGEGILHFSRLANSTDPWTSLPPVLLPFPQWLYEVRTLDTEVSNPFPVGILNRGLHGSTSRSTSTVGGPPSLIYRQRLMPTVSLMPIVSGPLCLLTHLTLPQLIPALVTAPTPGCAGLRRKFLGARHYHDQCT
jgi:hypothetical protein